MYGIITTLVPLYLVFQHISIIDLNCLNLRWSSSARGTSLHTQFFVNPKRAGDGIRPPPRHFLLYLSRLLFFRAETSWLFFFKPCAQFKTIFFLNRTGGYDAALRNRALGPTKNWPKTDFQWKLHTNRVFCILYFFVSGYTFTMFYLIYLVYLE